MTALPERRLLSLDIEGQRLDGELCLPSGAKGLVLFVHGSGSGRLSPRNQRVASYFHGRGLGTLLFDLLSAEEQAIDELTRELRFDIPLLTARLLGVIDWLAATPTLAPLRLGLFGASTGAASALKAAALRGTRVAALVSRGGRTDLAGEALPAVTAPTLLIVGGEDRVVRTLNRQSGALLRCPHELAVVPGATHLFEEPGALEQVARLAADWFERYLSEAAA